MCDNGRAEPRRQIGLSFRGGGILIVIGIAVSEIISLAFLAAMAGVEFGWLMNMEGVALDAVLNIAIGVVLSGVVFVGYVLTLRQQRKRAARTRTKTAENPAPKDDTSAPAGPFAEETGDDKKDDGWKIEQKTPSATRSRR